jgi:hypothetical protein
MLSRCDDNCCGLVVHGVLQMLENEVHETLLDLFQIEFALAAMEFVDSADSHKPEYCRQPCKDPAEPRLWLRLQHVGLPLIGIFCVILRPPQDYHR